MPTYDHSAAHQLIGGRYTLETCIGHGRLAVTYQARDRVLDRMVALKLLRSDYAADPHFTARFSREAWLAAPLSHANIVDLLDFGEHQGTLFIVLQFVPGSTLRQVLTQQGPPTPAAAVAVVQQVLRGLGAIHAAGIIHRDVKPENVLMGSDGVVRVADFGIAQRGLDETLTSHGETWGTAAYMSPEQAQGRELSAASDLYAVGVILYELLTGRLPFAAGSAVAMMLAHVSEAPVPPRWQAPARDIPPAVEQVTMQALAKEPAERFADAAAMSAALDAALGGTTAVPAVAALMPTPKAGPVEERAVDHAPVRRRRRWLRPALAGAVGVVFIVGGAAAWTMSDNARWLEPIVEVQAEPEGTTLAKNLTNLLLARGTAAGDRGLTVVSTTVVREVDSAVSQPARIGEVSAAIARVTPEASISSPLFRDGGASSQTGGDPEPRRAAVPGSTPSSEVSTETESATETATETETDVVTESETETDSGGGADGETPPDDTGSESPSTDEETVPPSTEPDAGGNAPGGTAGGTDGGTSGSDSGGGAAGGGSDGAVGEDDWNSEEGSSSGGEQSSEPATDSGVDAAEQTEPIPTRPA